VLFRHRFAIKSDAILVSLVPVAGCCDADCELTCWQFDSRFAQTARSSIRSLRQANQYLQL
jgi:hypothetical protein